MSTAVDEEGWGATDGGDVGALDVPIDPVRVSALGEVAGEPAHVQTELARVADKILEFEPVLILEEEVVLSQKAPCSAAASLPSAACRACG
jgi:hypothetical protein